MAHVFEDRVLESTTTTGTGALTLGGALTGFRTFASVMAATDTCYYAIWAVDGNGNPSGAWEVGLGTFNTTLARTTVYESSNAGSLVNFAAGTKYVALTAAASRTVQLLNDGRVLIGDTTSSTADTVLDLVNSSAIAMVMANVSTDATAKIGRIAIRHYTNTEEPFAVIGGNSGATANTIHIGGNSAVLNTATDITFYTAANQTTLTGTERARINQDGNVGIGTTALTGYSLRVSKPITGAVSSFGVTSDGTIQPDVTTNAQYFRTNAGTAANGGTGYTITTLTHYVAQEGTINADSTLTNQVGFLVNTTFATGTNLYAFRTQQAAATASWGFYADNAKSYFGGGFQMPALASEPAAPSSGVFVYAKEIIPGQTILKTVRPSGVDSPIQDGLAFNRMVKFVGSNNTIQAMGSPTLTAGTNTFTAVTPASGAAKTAVQRVQLANATNTAGNGTTLVAPNAGACPVFRGNVNGEGGFRFVARFALNATGTGNRFFLGLADTVTAATGAAHDPTTNTTPGRIGIGTNANTGNWFVIHTLTATTPTTIDLGANFPIDTTSLIELCLFVRPHNGTSAGNVGYRVRRYTTTSNSPAFEATGTISTNLPAATTLLHPYAFLSNNATAGTLSWHLNSITIESDW